MLYLNAVFGFNWLVNSFSVLIKQKNADQFYVTPWNTSTNYILSDIKNGNEKTWIQKAYKKFSNFFSVTNLGKLH